MGGISDGTPTLHKLKTNAAQPTPMQEKQMYPKRKLRICIHVNIEQMKHRHRDKKSDTMSAQGACKLAPLSLTLRINDVIVTDPDITILAP